MLKLSIINMFAICIFLNALIYMILFEVDDL